MIKTDVNDDIKTDVLVDESDGRLNVYVVVTNTTDEDIVTQSGMGSWCSIYIKDNNGHNRLEGMGSAAMVTTWEIPAQKSLLSKRQTDTKQEAAEKWEDIGRCEYIPDLEEYTKRQDEDAVFFAPNIDLPNESHREFTCSVRTDLKGYSTEIEFSFCPDELDKNYSINNMYQIK